MAIIYLKIFGTGIKQRFHQHRTLDIEAANSPLVAAVRARNTPPTRRRRLTTNTANTNFFIIAAAAFIKLILPF